MTDAPLKCLGIAFLLGTGTEPYPVRVVSQPSPDTWYIAYVVITALALLVGIGTLVALWLQTYKLTAQVRATQVSADAAKASADALINVERSWVLITDVEDEQIWKDSSIGKELISSVYFVCKNYGNSPAWINAMGGTFATVLKLSDLPTIPTFKSVTQFSDKSKVLIPISVNPDDWERYQFRHESDSNVHKTEGSSAYRQEVLWCAYGFVSYIDIFNEKRVTGFCYAYSGGKWRPVDAGPAYNYHR
jgi:hypothetical protein